MELSESEGLYFSGPDLRYGNNRNQSVIVGSPDAFVLGVCHELWRKAVGGVLGTRL
ncbi:MAG: hypothetical protein CM1200mP26_11360 [Acidimicrobiales bacterium]|nr:MAG: hypothetical protein CM1200mP26_11360 [Acidimicrobiales bacterium]